MTPRIPRIAAAVAALAVPALASAHPGHGLDPSGASWLHWLGEPEHALPLLALACVGALGWAFAGRRRRSG
jgi:hypothetical protein